MASPPMTANIPSPAATNTPILELFRVSHIVSRKFGIGRSFRFLFSDPLSDRRSSPFAAVRAELR